jgi:hypothetical protein
MTAGGLIDLVEIRQGDALQTLRTDLPDTIDLVLLDGAKALYPEILDLVESRLRPGALVSPTTPITAPTTWPACARPEAATCRRLSPPTSNCPCGSARSELGAPTPRTTAWRRGSQSVPVER